VENRLVPVEEARQPGTPPAGQVLVYVCPTDEERRYLLDELKVDEHTLSSSLDPDELARVEQDPEYMALIFKRPKSHSASDKFLFKVASVGAFLFKDKLIVVLGEDLALFDGKLYARVYSLQDLVLKMIYRSIQHFTEHLKVINMISSDLEQQIITAMENKNLINMFTLEKSLVYYLSAIQGNGAVIERLRMNAMNPMLVGFHPDNVELIDDLAIENKQCYEQNRIYSDILAGMMDARASIVNNNLNQLMKTLTMVMIAVMWPPLVCGYFAMNVRLPVNQTQSLWPFIVATVLGLVPVAFAFVYWFTRVDHSRRR